MTQAQTLEETRKMAAPSVPDAIPTRAVIRLWSLHLLCFMMPLTTLAFALSGPHTWFAALPFLGVIAASVIIDRNARGAYHQPARSLPGWPFNGVLYVLTALQLANVVFVAAMMSRTTLWSVDGLVAVVLLGVSSGYSGIVVAHELMHRREKRFHWMARALMASVLYEHFFTEHVRGHHVRVGTLDDPATARFGETFVQFFRRTVPAQFRSAWRLEAKRLGDETMRWTDSRLLRSRVLHGVLAEVAIVAALAWAFGVTGVVVFALQALVAIELLEAVNYFEHYGLIRRSKRVRPVDSWDTDSWFSLFSLVGLSRHADHHAFASRPYEQLRHWEQSPKLPYGYFGMVWMVLTRNQKFRDTMEERLRQHRLGPFEITEAEAGTAAAA